MKMVKGIYVLLTMFLLIGCATVMNPAQRKFLVVKF